MVAERKKQNLSLIPEVISRGGVVPRTAAHPAKLRSALPAGLEMERLWGDGRLEALRGLGERAQYEVSRLLTDAALTASGAYQMTTLLSRVAQEGGWLTPEMEQTLAQLTLNHLQTTLCINDAVSVEMIQTVRDLAQRSRTPGLWDTVALWLKTH